MRLAIFLCLVATSAIADDNRALVNFARANEGKFNKEISQVDGVAMGSMLTVRGKFDRVDVMSVTRDYDPDAGQMTFRLQDFVMRSMRVSRLCKPGQSFVGQNAFGAKATVRTQSCESFVVSDPDSTTRSYRERVVVKMSPDQYREIKKSGVNAEFDFTVGHHTMKEQVVMRPSFSEATIDEPLQSASKVWSVYGTVTAVRWALPGDKQLTEIWTRVPAETSAQPLKPSYEPTDQGPRRAIAAQVAEAERSPSIPREQVGLQQRDLGVNVPAEAGLQRQFLKMVPSMAPNAKGVVWIASLSPASNPENPGAVMGVSCNRAGKFAVVVGTGFVIKKTWSIAPPLTDVRYTLDGDETRRNWEQYGPSEAGPMNTFGGLGGFIDRLVSGKTLQVAFEREDSGDREVVTFDLDRPGIRDSLVKLRSSCH